MDAPDFVVVGHAVRDLVPDGWRLGGTVTFAAVQAHRLGLSVGIVARAGPDLDVAAAFPFAQVVRVPDERTTSFENVYAEGHRRQRVPERAGAIAPDDVPEAWRAPRIAMLGPVLGELGEGFAGNLANEALVGVDAQGWLRDVDAEGVVIPRETATDFWSGCDVLFVSDEDLAADERSLERWTREVPVVAVTESWKGARVFADGAWHSMHAFPEREVDPTGAGDTFATAFLVRLSETDDIEEAARFGAAAASISVGGIAAESIATREEIEARLRAHPEIVLR